MKMNFVELMKRPGKSIISCLTQQHREGKKIPLMGYHLIMNVKVEVMESSDVLKTHKSIISHLFETMISE